MSERTLEGRDTAMMSVRELMAELAAVQDDLRRAPLLTRVEGVMGVNPDLAPLLRRQRQLVARLRARRSSWVRLGVGASRPPSAAWPPPPWAH